ncbi:SIS domain-containing protein [Oleispirillum naphthae]|uniref:D-sedoheptulose-7-phosphate isomerase n=1 Tax=Oleispirillum naphthae TaxID=2838853 RepID=UPI0030825C79
MSCIVAGASGLETYLLACADRMRAAATLELEAAFNAAVEAISAALSAGRPLLICGNGGSMADAQHIAGELVARFLLDRKALPVIALGANAATLTAWGNDIGFAGAFAREVEAFGAAGGVLLAISTSGNSPNILAAVEQAKTMGMTTVALTGGSGGKLAPACDIAICPKADGAAAIQELHTPIFHRLCELVEARCAGA